MLQPSLTVLRGDGAGKTFKGFIKIGRIIKAAKAGHFHHTLIGGFEVLHSLCNSFGADIGPQADAVIFLK
jgi:hypothetical protein